MVLFSPLGDRVLAKPIKYASLAHLALSLVSRIWSCGSSCKSCTECPGLQKCSATPEINLKRAGFTLSKIQNSILKSTRVRKLTKI